MYLVHWTADEIKTGPRRKTLIELDGNCGIDSVEYNWYHVPRFHEVPLREILACPFLLWFSSTKLPFLLTPPSSSLLLPPPPPPPPRVLLRMPGRRWLWWWCCWQMKMKGCSIIWIKVSFDGFRPYRSANAVSWLFCFEKCVQFHWCLVLLYELHDCGRIGC